MLKKANKLYVINIKWPTGGKGLRTTFSSCIQACVFDLYSLAYCSVAKINATTILHELFEIKNTFEY